MDTQRQEAIRATVEGTGVMHRAGPGTPAERERRRVDAVAAVLCERLEGLFTPTAARELAEECIAAADTGI